MRGQRLFIQQIIILIIIAAALINLTMINSFLLTMYREALVLSLSIVNKMKMIITKISNQYKALEKIKNLNTKEKQQRESLSYQSYISAKWLVVVTVLVLNQILNLQVNYPYHSHQYHQINKNQKITRTPMIQTTKNPYPPLISQKSKGKSHFFLH